MSGKNRDVDDILKEVIAPAKIAHEQNKDRVIENRRFI